MADQPAILQADKGAATRLALWTLSALVLVQSGVILWLLLPRINTETFGSTTAAVPTVETNITPSSAPAPTMPLTGLPALPPPPAGLGGSPTFPLGGALPPPPSELFASKPTAAIPSAPSLPVATMPERTTPQPPPFTQSPRQSRPTPVEMAPTPRPASPVQSVPVSLTGHAEVDELVSTAKEMISLNDPVATKAAVEALQRADLLLPEHPIVLREMALAYQKLNDSAKAKSLFERASVAQNNPRPSAPVGPTSGSGTMRAADGPGLGSAFAETPSAPVPSAGPIMLGQCKVARDLSSSTGEKQILRMEMKAMPGAVINPDNINIDVFFYDVVDGTRVEPSKGDKPQWKFDLPVDFKNGGVELVDITYHMPNMTEAEKREHGIRAYHGYVVKLYYQGRFMGEAAEPRALLTNAPRALPGAPALQP